MVVFAASMSWAMPVPHTRNSDAPAIREVAAAIGSVERGQTNRPGRPGVNGRNECCEFSVLVQLAQTPRAGIDCKLKPTFPLGVARALPVKSNRLENGVLSMP